MGGKRARVMLLPLFSVRDSCAPPRPIPGIRLALGQQLLAKQGAHNSHTPGPTTTHTQPTKLRRPLHF